MPASAFAESLSLYVLTYLINRFNRMLESMLIIAYSISYLGLLDNLHYKTDYDIVFCNLEYCYEKIFVCNYLFLIDFILSV